MRENHDSIPLKLLIVKGKLPNTLTLIANDFNWL